MRVLLASSPYLPSPYTPPHSLHKPIPLLLLLLLLFLLLLLLSPSPQTTH